METKIRNGSDAGCLPEDKPVTEFEVTGYDKDNDIYDVLFVTSSLASARLMANSLRTLCNSDRILSSCGREPYDRIETWTGDGGKVE